MLREKFNKLEDKLLDLSNKIKSSSSPEKEELLSLLEEIKNLNQQAETEHENIYKDVFLECPDPVAIFEKNEKDETFVLVDINDACAVREGVDREKIKGENFAEFLPKFAQSQLMETLTEVFKTGKAQTIEYQIKEKEGKPVWLKNHVFKAKSGKLFASSIDITEEKIIEEKFKESERKYLSLFNNPKWIMLTIDFESQKIVDANRGAELFYGWTRDELLNMSVQEINVLPPEDISKKMKEAKEKQLFYFEFQHRKKDGSESFVAVLKGDNIILNNREVFSVIVLDLTDRKKMEMAFIESEQRYKKLLDSGNVAIFVHPFKEKGFSKFIEVNKVACEWLGYTRDELLQMTVNEIDVSDNNGVRASRLAMKELQKMGKSFFESTLVTKNKRIIPVEIYANVINYKNTKAILSIVHDVTEKIKAKIELKKRMTELERFNKIMVGRELRMLALKKEINSLLAKIGEPAKYKVK